MEQNYLFVHFKETRSPEGEQVYFGISRDGFNWELCNDGNPVLWSYLGEKGVRDMTIARTQDNKFVIFATDLSLAYSMRFKYHNSWGEVSRNGSHALMMWKSDDLIHWEDERAIELGDETFGCHWAPDIIFDSKSGDYILHWSSPTAETDYQSAIYYSRTKDFETFSKPAILYRSENPNIDSAMYEQDGKFYLFVKQMKNPTVVRLLVSDNVTGPFTIVNEFDECMRGVIDHTYEAPTAFKASNGQWVLMLDFFGTRNAWEQGYVPFVSDDISSGIFKRSDAKFSFPYGYKHGTVLTITPQEYERLKTYKKSSNEY